MKSLVRKIVAGPKKKTPYNGQELDLTYITDRVIAMAYPASNFFEKTYRNSIDDVVNYFNEYHKDNYLIFNVSSRPYDYSKFDGRVVEYEWPDHQAPPITTLVDLSYRAKKYLESNKHGVIAVHCNHGKGRTGTAIISFILYLSLYEKAAEALAYYNSRRFSNDEYGVDQPCQTRYLTYIEKLTKIEKVPKKLIAYRLVAVNHKGLSEKYFITINKARDGSQLIHKFNIGERYSESDKPLMADIFIQLFEQTWSGSKKVARINYNTYFLNLDYKLNTKQLSVQFQSKDIKCKTEEIIFTVKLEFQFYCLCHVQGSEGIQCQCKNQRKKEEFLWAKMVDQLEQVKNLKPLERNKYFYYQSTGLENCLKKQKEQDPEEISQNIYPLTKNMSNLSVENAQILGKMTRIKSLDLEQKEYDRQFIEYNRLQSLEIEQQEHSKVEVVGQQKR